MSDRRSWDRRLAVLLPLAVVGTAWGTGVVNAGPSPHLRSGLVGIARLQTARLSAVRYPQAVPGETSPAAVACMATLAFHRAGGETYMTRSGEPVQREVALMPDGTAMLDLRSFDVSIDNLDLLPPSDTVATR